MSPRRFELRLLDGTLIPSPAFGSGTGPSKERFPECGKLALKAGFYHMDTAQLYAQGRNEAETGKLLEGIPREQCFLTSKLSQKGDNNDQPVPIDQIRQSVMDSIAKLGRKPDLYLVHNPYVMGDGSGKPDQLVAGWKVLEDLKDEGLLMSIGVSNFRPQDIQAILDKCEYRPTVNQLEFHPQLLAHLAPLIEIQRKNGIITEAYGGLQPLIKNQGSRLEPVVNEIAKRLSNESGKPVEPAIVLLLWCHAMDVVAVTTSSQEERIKAFAAINELPALTSAEVEKICEVGKQTHFRSYTEHMETDFPIPDLPSK